MNIIKISKQTVNRKYISLHYLHEKQINKLNTKVLKTEK